MPGGAKKGARKLTKTTEWAITDAIARGGSLREAARCARISYPTLCRWMKMGREQRRTSSPGKCYRLLRAVEEARAKCIDTLDSIEWTIATDTKASPGARLRAVESIRNRIVHQGRPMPLRVEVSGQVEYEHTGEVQHEHTGTVETPRPVLADRDVRNLTTEQLDGLAAALQGIVKTQDSAEA